MLNTIDKIPMHNLKGTVNYGHVLLQTCIHGMLVWVFGSPVT